MNDYALFGGCLRSEVELPGLRSGPQSAADWTLRIVPRLEIEALHLLGESRTCDGVRIRLCRHRNGYRLTYSDSGSFDIVGGGRSIEWLPGENHRIELVRLDVINFVMATALHAGGTLSLHASAVVMGGEAMAFIAPKGSGKSTLAMAVARTGAALLCDDMLALRAGPPPAALPGVQQLRLEPDAAAYFEITRATESLASERASGSSAQPPAVEDGSTPLGALYVLDPSRSMSGSIAVARDRMSPAESAIAVQANMKLAHLLGVEGAAELLTPVGELTRHVPVYRLTLRRDLAVLPAAVDALQEWHGSGLHTHRRAGNRPRPAHRDPSLRSG